MVEHKVSCPQCHSTLKSGKPIPAGMKLKCPRCGLLFTAPHASAGSGPHPRAAVAPAAVSAAVQASPPAIVSPAAVAITAAPAVNGYAGQVAAPAPTTAPSLDKPAPSRARAIALVSLGGFALVAIAVVGVILCFSGDAADTSPQPSPDNPPLPQPVGVKKLAPPPALITLPPEQQKKVDEAVARAVKYLRSRQRPDGTWANAHSLGLTSMAALTLLEAGAKANDPAIEKAVKHIRGKAPTYSGAHEVYEISLAVLFLDKLGDPQDKGLIQKLTLRLVAAQTPQGGWNYRCPPLAENEYAELLTGLEELQKHPADHFVRNPGAHAALSPRVQRLAVLQPEQGQAEQFYRSAAGGDNSNTQFAVLALLAARRHGVPLDRSLALINKRFRSTQNRDGSWNYRANGNVSKYPTMTCAGLLGLAVGFGLEEKGKHAGKPDEDPQVRKGLEHLSKHIDQPSGPAGKPPMMYLYYLWSVERVGVLYQQKTINGKKWYEWGVELLLTHQRPDGSWKSMGPAIGSTPDVDTCFGILFLQRANLAKDLTDKLLELSAARPGAAPNAPPGPGRKD